MITFIKRQNGVDVSFKLFLLTQNWIIDLDRAEAV